MLHCSIDFEVPSSVGGKYLFEILYIHPAFVIMAAIHQFTPIGDT